MSKVRRAGPTVWQGTAHASNKFFKGYKPKTEQEPESSEAQPSVPGDTNPEGKRGNTGNPGNSRYPLPGHKTAASVPSFSDQRAKWSKYSAEMQLKAKLAAQGGVKPDQGVVGVGVGVGVGLAYDYLRRHKPEIVVGLNLDLDPKCTQLTQAAMRGLETFESVGHFDIVKHDMYNVYLDTADSVESMMVCREWFYTLTRSHRATKILLYNKTSDSNAKDLLTILRFNVNFDEAHFVPCPNFSEGEILPDEEWHVMEEMQRAKRNARTWRGLCEQDGKKDTSQTSASVNAFFEHVQAKYGDQKFGMKSEFDVLVTGSRPLVAATITMLNKMRGFPG
ncbi:GL15882 [Drosophila persimilis]|uniref:GL15882 n=1 Tax=Drosophila persimilis TaxID=7234 RepID=B4H0X2_DROPE|nr:GL15882 [Drosophila persimilis]